MNGSSVTPPDESGRRGDPSLGRFLVLVIAVAGFWLATPIVLNQFYKPPENVGAFGDLFGSINALFSGLAFAGLFYAILLQRRELELQRLELQATREEMRLARLESSRSAAAQETSARLSAVTTLIEHHRLQIERVLHRLRVPDASHVTGFRSRELTEHETAHLDALQEKLTRYLSDLEEVYGHAPHE